MTDEKMNESFEGEESSRGDRSSDPLGGLLARALADAPAPPKSLLPGIQHRIRVRTKGLYYRDRWGGTRGPISLLLMVALLILIMVAAIFLVMHALVEAPASGDAGRLGDDAAPVRDETAEGD